MAWSRGMWEKGAKGEVPVGWGQPTSPTGVLTGLFNRKQQLRKLGDQQISKLTL